MKKLLVLISILAGFAAMASAQGIGRIAERQWKLVALDGANVSRNSNAYLEINRGDVRFTGNTGCNRMFGSVEIKGRRISFLGVGTTKMACLDSRARRTETAFLSALARAERFNISGNTLEIWDRRRVIIRFDAPVRQRPEEPSDRVQLDDRKWILHAIKATPVSTLGRTAFVVFDETKGSAGGNSSCNVFGGSYTATGQTIKITDVIATMRACVEDDRMTIERQFLDGLRNANRYEIRGNKLTLYRNQRELLGFTGERK